ncbi:ferritin-like domain-containing protein [Ulvibacter antarcticus]|uniref:Uncharacterized protein (TIGR02284 family) n=1 Tax=Ulvibacter antarcticus TaxID=442714 RepID=A0A3L9YDE9_9FLAO|nr:PA2169 family four-helix-bundle protein [Ulvibacter antarcticus]RMA58681.1 uncharacterized protein (TIGR02284 family) [Ulvibacter antarcticus]
MKTTKEKADENIHENLVGNLQGLLEKNYDAEKGFTKAMQDSKNQQLKNFLKHQAAQHARFATELDHEIRSLNETPKESGSTAGTLHRAWIGVKTAFTSDNDEAVLEECIRGEKACAEDYEETLNENRFSPNISSVLNNQLSQIKQTVSKVKSLEDIADSWS